MRPGKLCKITPDPSGRSDAVIEFAGYDESGCVSWEKLVVFSEDTYVVAVCPFRLTYQNFKPKKGDENDLRATIRQAVILATTGQSSYHNSYSCRIQFKTDGIPGYKFLSTKGLIWVSHVDIEGTLTWNE